MYSNGSEIAAAYARATVVVDPRPVTAECSSAAFKICSRRCSCEASGGLCSLRPPRMLVRKLANYPARHSVGAALPLPQPRSLACVGPHSFRGFVGGESAANQIGAVEVLAWIPPLDQPEGTIEKQPWFCCLQVESTGVDSCHLPRRRRQPCGRISDQRPRPWR